jgi:hypothetical protein
MAISWRQWRNKSRPVSSLLTPLEYGLRLLQWHKVFTPVDVRQQDAWESDWTHSLVELPYMRVMKKTREYQLDKLLAFQCQMNFSGGNMEIVKADLERVWSNELSADLEAYHSFGDTPDGFEFFFAALNEKNNYLTGFMDVRRKRGR